MPDDFQKLFFFSPGNIYVTAIVHFNLAAVAFNLFFYMIKIDQIRMVNAEEDAFW